MQVVEDNLPQLEIQVLIAIIRREFHKATEKTLIKVLKKDPEEEVMIMKAEAMEEELSI